MLEGREDGCFLMVGVVYGGICYCQVGAHGCASELKPVCVVKLEDIVCHNEFGCFKNHLCGVVLGQIVLVEGEPFLEGGKGMYRVDVCVHGDCVSCKDDSCGWEFA